MNTTTDAIKGLTPVQRRELTHMGRNEATHLPNALSTTQAAALVRRGLAVKDGARHALTELGAAVADVLAGGPERRAAEEALRRALDAVVSAEGAQERAEAYRAAARALEAADEAGVEPFLSVSATRALEQVERAQRVGAERVERLALRVAEEWRAQCPQEAAQEGTQGAQGGEGDPAAPVVCKGTAPAALPALDGERTATAMARLDRVYLAGYVTAPGLSCDERRVAALVVADECTDGGARLTATGMTRDESFWWHYNGSAYDLVNAYGSARLAAGAVRRSAHVCGWGCGTPCPQAAQEAVQAAQEGAGVQGAQEVAEAADGAQEAAQKGEGDPAWVARRDAALGAVGTLLDGTVPAYRRTVMRKGDAVGMSDTMATDVARVYLAEEVADGGSVCANVVASGVVLTRANGARLWLEPVA